MKILSKFLCYMFFIFFFVYNCSAVKDCRSVLNDNIVSEIIRHHNIVRIIDEYFSIRDYMCCQVQFNKMVFAINRENANQMFISVPVFSSVRKYVGEVITPILFENIYTIDDALKIMTSNFEAHPKFKLGDSYYKHFFRARKSLTSNVSVDSIVEFLQENFMIEENDRIFYVTHSDRLTDSFDDVCLVLESADGDVVVESVFQPRENQSPSFFSKLFSFFKKNRVTEPDRPYARLPEID